jgi:hypothetical protein
MAWEDGDILFSSNFEMRVAKPMDAKQIVPTNVDLNSITFPYDGLIVHVTATQETYVCIAKDDVPTGAPLGVIDADVWKVVGGAAADVLVLPDQSPAPSGIADKSQLVSLDDATAESRPDFLYRFNEGVDVATATDDGRLQANGTKYNTDGDGYGATSGGAFGDNYAVFSPAKDPRISVGTAGAAAPFYFTSAGGDRGDFEIQFRFAYEADDANYSLLSTQLTSADTEGFYAVLIDTDIAGVNVEFRSRHLIDGVLTSFSAEWKTGASGSFTKQASRHLVISFMEDDRSITGNTNGGGKLRCYWDGVVCEDDKNAGAYHIAAPEFNNIGRRSSDGTVWALNLGQFLDGSSSGSPAPSIYFLDGSMDEFVVYNHRCLHNTSDKFTRPAVPTRSTALSMPNVVDSEGTASPILTTSNLGMLLPKSVEGLADGSPWNDKGVVKIAPLTGDLDATEVTGGVLSLPAGTLPAASSGIAKIYSKNILTGSDTDRLYHFSDNVEDSSGSLDADATIGGSNATQYVTPTDIGYTDTGGSWVSTAGNGFGKSIHLKGTSTSTATNWLEIPESGFGTDPFTIEFFMEPQSADANQMLLADDDGSASKLALYSGPGGSPGGRIYLWHNHPTEGSKFLHWQIYWDQSGKSRHWALQRGADNGAGKAQWSLFWDGDLISPLGTSYNGGLLDIMDLSDDWLLGRYRHATIYQANMYFDEVRLTPSEVYSGSTYTVPTDPLSVTNPVYKAKLFAMDSVGAETQLTP